MPVASLKTSWCGVTFDGSWIVGKVQGLSGRWYTFEKDERRRPGGQEYRRLVETPAFLLHTTEGDQGDADPNDLEDALNGRLSQISAFPQWMVGEHRIVQLRPTWAAGAALNADSTGDPNLHTMQVEVVENSQMDRGVFDEHAQDPLVALIAVLDLLGLIKPLQRPEGWPVYLDTRNGEYPASLPYWRRLTRKVPYGPYIGGHVDVHGNTHWDPGSYDYDVLIAQVRELQGGDWTMADEAPKWFRSEVRKAIWGIEMRPNDAGKEVEFARISANEAFAIGRYILGRIAFRRFVATAVEGDPLEPPAEEEDAYAAGWLDARHDYRAHPAQR